MEGVRDVVADIDTIGYICLILRLQSVFAVNMFFFWNNNKKKKKINNNSVNWKKKLRYK